jgi:hypothetical protein
VNKLCMDCNLGVDYLYKGKHATKAYKSLLLSLMSTKIRDPIFHCLCKKAGAVPVAY